MRSPSSREIGTCHMFGCRRDVTDQVLQVRFAGYPKVYSYFYRGTSMPLEAGTCFAVIANGQRKIVHLVGSRPSTETDCLKRVLARTRHSGGRIPDDEKVYYNPPETTETTGTTKDTTMIKITNQTLVNGQDVKRLDDSEIISLLRGAQHEIDTLSQVVPLPKRFEKKIQDLKDGRAALIELLDKIDEEEA